MSEGLRVYRALLRAIHTTFKGDVTAVQRATEKLRANFHNDKEGLQERQDKIKLGYQIVDFLKRNLVQAKLNPRAEEKPNINLHGKVNNYNCREPSTENSQFTATEAFQKFRGNFDADSALIYAYKISPDHEMTDNSAERGQSCAQPSSGTQGENEHNGNVQHKEDEHNGSIHYSTDDAKSKALRPLAPCRTRCPDCSCGRAD